LPAQTLQTDALVIGAGPVGLFQVFQLGLQGVHAQVVDALPVAGGQCIALYADKPIYDIPAIKVCTGRELVQNLLSQIAPFAPGMHLNQTVETLERQSDGRYLAKTSAGLHFLARTVFIAGGVGAFAARRLHLPGLEVFEGKQVHYRLMPGQAAKTKNALVIGAEQTALDAAIALCEGPAASVTLVHRRDTLHADAQTLARVATLRASGRLRFVAAQASGFTGKSRLHSLLVLDSDEQEISIKADGVWAFLGVSPKLGPLAEWGLDMERKQLRVDPADFSTSAPGIFAVGDINHYAGKKKLIVCGFHEATLAAFAAMESIRPGQAQPLQYTTTSTELHRRLGVSK